MDEVTTNSNVIHVDFRQDWISEDEYYFWMDHGHAIEEMADGSFAFFMFHANNNREIS